MTEQDPQPASHWGAPDPTSRYPAQAKDGAHAAPRRPRERTQILASYVLMGAAGVITLVGSGVLAYSSIKGPESRPGRDFSVQGAPTLSPTGSPSDGQQRISPSGAPYSYALPQGFVVAPVPKSSATGQSGVFESAIIPRGAAGGDIIAVSVYTLGANSDAFSYEQLEAEIERLATKVTRDPGEAERVRVAGKRGLKYLFDYGTTKVMNYFVFAGNTEVQVRCQWTNAEPVIDRGCDDVVASLVIK